MPIAERLLAGALEPWLAWRSRPERVRSALAGLTYQCAVEPQGPQVRIAIVQFGIGLTHSAPEYARHAYGLVRQAVVGGASLVVFPEYASLPLLGLLPGAQRLADSLAKGSGGQTAGPADTGGDYATMAMAFRLAAPAAQRVYHLTFSTLAARFSVTLLAGSLIERGSDGRLRNVGHLFGPDGALLTRQVKTHLVPSEVAMAYGVGEEIVVTETAAGRLAFPICMDHTYFETARIAALSGAELLIDPAANNEYYSAYAQARGVWNRVQEVRIYGVFCGAVGQTAGIVFQGRSGVYAPLELTPAGDGIVAEAKTVDQEEVVFADLDYAALRDWQRQHPLELNLALYRRYLPAAYSSDVRAGGARH